MVLTAQDTLPGGDSAGVTVPGPCSLTLDHSTLRTWTSWLVSRELLLTQPRGTVLVA